MSGPLPLGNHSEVVDTIDNLSPIIKTYLCWEMGWVVIKGQYVEGCLTWLL